MHRGSHRAPVKGRSKYLIVLLVVGMFVALAAPAFAADEYTNNVVKADHKVMYKVDHDGTFTGYYNSNYNWGGMAQADTVWTYKVHIKVAANEDASVGTVHLSADTPSGAIDVVGKVDATRVGYTYDGWADRTQVLLAVGTAGYNGETYYFMFLESEETMWLALSTTSYDTYVADNKVFVGSQRAYQIHSPLSPDQFTLDYKAIHPPAE
jgi:hypothetical protein